MHVLVATAVHLLLVLQETAEFQERYAHTVVYRMLYMLDRTEKGVLTLADLKRGSLAAAMSQLDTEEDINKVLRFFSYEHFYVMYCKVQPPLPRCLVPEHHAAGHMAAAVHGAAALASRRPSNPV